MHLKIFILPISVLLIVAFFCMFKYKSNLPHTPDISADYKNIMREEHITTDEIILEPSLVKEETQINLTTINSEETSAVNQANILNRVTYQPDFYYEEISEDLKKRIYGFSYKEDATIPFETLRYVRVLHTDLENTARIGEIICNEAIAQDLVEIFYSLYEAEYPIEQIRLIDEYNADDLLSMIDNNSSCFNYRVIAGTTTLSKHSLGMAIDINPFFNPYVATKKGVLTISPTESAYYADRTKEFAYKIDQNDLCYQLFTERGFTWGGAWKNSKDYQHFEKDITE